MSTTIISARINKKDRETLKEAGIDISQETRRHLEKIASEIRRKKSIDKLHKTIDRLMPPAKKGYGSRSVREDRESN